MITNSLSIFCDGGSRGNPGPAASAFVAQDNSSLVYQSGLFLGNTTNNQAEYSAVILALEWLESSQYRNYEITFYLDSLLVVNQIKGLYKVKDPGLKIKYLRIKDLISNFKFQISNFVYVPREQNSAADRIVNLTLDKHLTS